MPPTIEPSGGDPVGRAVARPLEEPVSWPFHGWSRPTVPTTHAAPSIELRPVRGQHRDFCHNSTPGWTTNVRPPRQEPVLGPFAGTRRATDGVRRDQGRKPVHPLPGRDRVLPPARPGLPRAARAGDAEVELCLRRPGQRHDMSRRGRRAPDEATTVARSAIGSRRRDGVIDEADIPRLADLVRRTAPATGTRLPARPDRSR